MGNEWPEGYRHAMHQNEHEAWNATHYPGTRQLCVLCESETNRCEEDAIYLDDDAETGPVCEECYLKYKNDKAISIKALS